MKKQYKFRFNGRQKGTIGTFGEFEATTEGENLKEAELQLYEFYEHIMDLRVRRGEQWVKVYG